MLIGLLTVLCGEVRHCHAAPTAPNAATGASATGASATGASATGASATGASATGASATGASATGASATGASATGASGSTPSPDRPQSHAGGPVPVPAASAKALRYYRTGTGLWVVNMLLGCLIPGLFLLTGFSAHLRDWAQQLGSRWVFAVPLYYAAFTLLTFVIDLPLSYYSGFVRQHAYGLSNQTLTKWAGDTLKGLGIGSLIGCLIVLVFYGLLLKSPRWWWVHVSLLAVPFLCLQMLITPLWIDPLFNKFGPMQNKALEAKILALAQRARIEGGRVFEVNKSEDTNAVNAYVTGFAGSKRIVLWDTTLKKLNDREVLFIMGHEMGHYVLGHIKRGIGLGSLMILLTLYAAQHLTGWFITRYGDRCGFHQLADIASLPLILLVIHLLSLVTAPLIYAYTRHIEHEADRFGLEITRDNHAAATSFAKMTTANLSMPRPDLFTKLWRSTHPPLGERIDFCNTYKPWDKGEPLHYGGLFKDR